MIAFIYRFYNNTRKKERISSPNISVDEFEKAEKILLRLVQKESFSGSTDPKLRALRPLEDKNGLLRAKTNIICRQDKEDFRSPIILPSKHPVVQKLIFEKHLENHHAGVSILMAQLREKFWILKSRKYIRNVIRQCVKYQRFQTLRTEVEPGIPPEDRIRDAAIFEVMGVDLARPLYLADGSKAWIALFTCAVYRAVHLELITSLSAECFMQSLRRFIARRGRPHTIYSDNGKNFVGTSRALSSVDWEAIRALASIQKIRWKLNPPAAPWWGGWWERLVRMVKEILRKVLGRASLNYEELSTILCDCEHVINSRPITYISEDNRDPEPLTPLMFLQELPTSGVPDIDTLDSQDLNRRARYRQRIRNDLRNRFRTEYLGQLRQQSMKKENSKPLKQPETEDYASCSDFEDKLKNSSSSRTSKKKKLILESESESDSCVSETAEKEAVNSETSDEDEPLNKVLEKAEVNKSSKKMNVSSDSSNEDEPLVTTNCSVAVNNSSVKSESEENGVETSDDDAPISRMIEKSEMNGKSKNVDVLSENSDDEPLATRKSSNHSETIESSKSSKADSKENEIVSSDDDALINRITKKSKQSGKSKKIRTSSVSSSDDEPLAAGSSPVHSESEKSSKKASEPEENGFGSSDDDDAPISKVVIKSKQNGNTEIVKTSSVSSSDDEPLAARSSSVHSKSKKSSKEVSESEENGDSSSSDSGKPLKKVLEESNSKSKKMKISSDSSEDEPLDVKSSVKNKSKKQKSKGSSSDDDDEPLSSMAETTNGKSKQNKSLNSDSEDEPLTTKKTMKNKSKKQKNGGSSSDDDDEPLSSMAETTNGKSKQNKFLNSDSEDEPLTTKKTVKQKSKKQKNGGSSSDDDEPLSSMAEMTNGKSKQNEFLNSDSEDEPLTTKKTMKHKPKKQKNGHVSSDEEEPLSKLQKSSNVKDKKTKSSSNDKIENLKKYLRLSGIHIQSYDKLFADCKSIKAKTEKLLSILHEKGLKGRPTIEKCKKLRKKIETKKEISELDMSNIIQTEGRPKRGSGGTTQKAAKIENSPAEKRFSRLKDIIDSEESD